ncbi:MAG: hypothetical protein IJX81_07085 [Clostridia bacterium]|nr:hypothetical protein [Clostridia bacterium]
MKLKEEQTRFDEVKWFASVAAGADQCGSYSFCGCCNKENSYPCARAARRYARGGIRVATVTVKKIMRSYSE